MQYRLALVSAYRDLIAAAAAKHGLDPALVDAVVQQESNDWASAFRYEPAFWTKYLANNPAYKNRNPREVSSSYGLMQVMFPTAVDHGFVGEPWELFDPALNLDLGVAHLAAQIKWASALYVGLEGDRQAASTRAGLAAYNGGRTGNAPTGPLRNREYADEVLARFRRLREFWSQP